MAFFNKVDPATDLINQVNQLRDQVQRTSASLQNSGMSMAAEKLNGLIQNIDTILKDAKQLQDVKLQQAANTEKESLNSTINISKNP